ncbi:hypothetical protein ACKWTF_011220 [Chironomus riparius]
MIKTKASLLKEKEQNVVKEFKAVKFEGLKRLPKTKPPQSYDNKNKDTDDEEFDAIFGDGPRKRPKKDKNEVTFDKARREILNLGISGANATDQSDQITQLLVKLGAKPPKRQARNYKEILDERKKMKDEDSKINKRAIFGTSASLQYRGQKKTSRNDGLLRSYGRVDKESIKKMQQKDLGKRKRK